MHSILTALNDASTDYSQSELTQSIPGLCYNSTYTLTLTHKLTVDLTQNNDRGECDVSLELGDQTITLLYADTNGAESTPFPANEERDHIPFVYQRKGQDDPNTFTVALYCIVSFSFASSLSFIFLLGEPETDLRSILHDVSCKMDGALFYLN